MSSTTDLLDSIKAAGAYLTLAELLVKHPDIARRTAQRTIAKLNASGHVIGQGEDRARRYFAAEHRSAASHQSSRADHFPDFIPVSADSQDILAYIDQQ